MIEAEQARIGIIIEVKYAENIKTLDKACQKALKQIKEKELRSETRRRRLRNNIKLRNRLL